MDELRGERPLAETAADTEQAAETPTEPLKTTASTETEVPAPVLSPTAAAITKPLAPAPTAAPTAAPRTKPLAPIVSPTAAPLRKPLTKPPTPRKRRWRLALVGLSALVLLASLVAASSLNSGSVNALLMLFGTTPTASMLQSDSPGTGIFQQRIPYRGNYTPTVTGTPSLIGDGAPSWGGTFPSYNGPITPGQGCPNGRAPSPRGYVIRQASDYGAPKLSEVALTFDDGPTPYYSPAIISYLEQTHTPATFFVLGQYAKAYPYLIQREAADGFAIGIHTWSHPDMTKLSPAQRAWQLVATAQQLHQDLGASFCLWLWRPPYGDYNGAIIAQAGKLGLTTINWSVDPADWSQPGTQAIVNRVLAGARPGAIILMHDGPAGRAETLAALPAILAGLKARGLTPVTVPQLLLGAAQPTPTTPPAPTATPTQEPTVTPTDTPMPPTDTPTLTDMPIP